MEKTVYVLTPVSRKAKSWIKKNISCEDYQVRDSSVAVEHRYIDPIVSAMEEAGLEYDKDFLVW